MFPLSLCILTLILTSMKPRVFTVFADNFNVIPQLGITNGVGIEARVKKRTTIK